MKTKINWIGPHFINKGERKKAVADAQYDFFKQLTADYKAQFAKQGAIIDALTAVFRPILEAGPDQMGYAPETVAVMRTMATDEISAATQQASQATREAFAARGGGQVFIPSGAEAQIESQILTQGAISEAEAQNRITAANYEAGRQQWLTAANVMGSTAGLINPVGYAQTNVGAGSAALQGAVEAEKGGFWSAVGGILGGAAGAFANATGSSLGGALGRSSVETPTPSPAPSSSGGGYF